MHRRRDVFGLVDDEEEQEENDEEKEEREDEEEAVNERSQRRALRLRPPNRTLRLRIRQRKRERERETDIRSPNGHAFTIPSFAINVTYLCLKRTRAGAHRAHRAFINDVTPSTSGTPNDRRRLSSLRGERFSSETKGD